jgi:hypothetical protein
VRGRAAREEEKRAGVRRKENESTDGGTPGPTHGVKQGEGEEEEMRETDKWREGEEQKERGKKRRRKIEATPKAKEEDLARGRDRDTIA